MEIKADVELPFPRELVFSTYRDRMSELTEYLPNIRSIKVLERRDLQNGVELVNEWIGGGDIPKVARAVLSENMLRWTDYATWKPASYSVDWRTVVHAFPGAVTSSGRNLFVATAQGTRLEIRGNLVCDSAKVPGVPKIFARMVNQAAEKLLVGQISTNLTQVANGVTKLLQKSEAQPSP